MLQDVGFTEIAVGQAVDTFGGAGGEANARAYEVYGYSFLARKPPAGLPRASRGDAEPV